MKNIKHYLSITILIIGLVNHNYTITMAKKCALLAALISTTTHITLTAPSPLMDQPIDLPSTSDTSFDSLKYSDPLYQALAKAAAIKALAAYVTEGDLEKTLCSDYADQELYQGLYENYINIMHAFESERANFTRSYPTFQPDIQHCFDYTCCDKHLIQSIRKYIECCNATSNCQPDCSGMQKWQDTITACDQLTNQYACNTTLPHMVPTKRIQPFYRFNETVLFPLSEQYNSDTIYSLSKEESNTHSTPTTNVTKQSNPLDNAQEMHAQLYKALFLRLDIDEFESGEREQALVKAGNDYLTHYNKYMDMNYDHLSAYKNFTKTYPDFQKNLQQFSEKVCCDKLLMNHIIDSFVCCGTPSCAPSMDCSPIQKWKSAYLICTDLSSWDKYKGCNTTIPQIMPDKLKPRRRFSNFTLLLANKSDESHSDECDELTA